MLLLTLMCFCVPVIWFKSFPSASQTSTHPLNTKIVNGERATLGQFPWQVGLLQDNGFCGGSIISKEWIITAAHCLYSDDIRVKTVMIFTGSVALMGGEVAIASTIIPHERYEPSMFANDIGLVKLYTPLILSNTTSIIGLSSKPLGSGVTVTVSGWGRTSDESQFVSTELNYVHLQTISNDKCKEVFSFLVPQTVCAQSGLKSPCNGDSGGPVVIDVGSNPQLVALVSFGRVTCAEGFPSAYTRIEPYLGWIRQHTGITSGARANLIKILVVLVTVLSQFL